jgi:hypothetical protein
MPLFVALLDENQWNKKTQHSIQNQTKFATLTIIQKRK